MKKILYLFFLIAMGVSSQAETVSSVSFNPSRMGEYNYLKVSDAANFRGGLNANTLNISSGGTVSMTSDSPFRTHQINNVIGAPTSMVQMPNTVFHGNSMDLYNNYNASNSTAPSGLMPKVYASGGVQTYNNDSYISTVKAVNILKQKAGTVKAGTLTVSGNAGNSVTLHSGDATYGFHLAGNDIPEPTGMYTNTGAALTGCSLVWEKRRTSDNPAQEVWLLGLQNCSGTGGGGGDGGDEPDPPTGTYSWKYDGWREVASFGCGSDAFEQAQNYCRRFPATAPSGSCTGGDTIEAQCTANDYCPGKGVAAEVIIYTCRK